MIISPEQFKEAYKKLPFLLREYIAQDDLSEIAESIGKKYGLHVDTIGALYRETTNMLLGLINPSQFVGELKSVGIPETSIGPIVEELNRAVFIPLREKMKNPPQESDDSNENESAPVGAPTASVVATPTTVTPSAPLTPPMPIAPIQPPAPTPIQFQTQPVTPASAPILPGSYEPVPYISKPTPAQAPTPAPAAPATPPPAPAYTAAPPAPPSVSQFSAPVSVPVNSFSVSTPVVPPENVIPPHVRTMQEDMRMSQSSAFQQPAHQDPAPLTAPVRPPAYTQPPVRPLVTQAPTSVSLPAQNSAVSQPSAFVMPKAPATPLRTTFPSPPAPQAGNRDALHAVLKEYGVDPYREPAE